MRKRSSRNKGGAGRGGGGRGALEGEEEEGELSKERKRKGSSRRRGGGRRALEGKQKALSEVKLWTKKSLEGKKNSREKKELSLLPFSDALIVVSLPTPSSLSPLLLPPSPYKLPTPNTPPQEYDILASLPAFRSFARNGVDASLVCAKSSQLPKLLAEELFSVCKHNMEKAYDAAWGWSDGAKRAELTHDAARYILVSEKRKEEEEEKAREGEEAQGAAAAAAADDSSSPPALLASLAANPSDLLAYVHFRFETDEATQRPILYVYEVQLRDEPKTRRKGLGRFLMQLLELAARTSSSSGVGLEAISLTVQDSNHAAAALYASLGYVRDAGSPCPLEEPEAGYTILTKPLPPPKQPLGAATAASAGGNGKSSATAAATDAGSSAAPSGKAAVAAVAAALASATVSSPAAAAVGQ